MIRSLLTIVMAFTLTTSAMAQRPDSGNSPAVPVLIVNGEAQIRVVPDEATVRLGIVRQAPSAQTVQDQANKVANEIITGITGLGIPATDIQTSRLNLTPVYAPRSPESSQAPRIVAYNASNIVSVRLSDLSKVGSVIDSGLKAGANEVQGVQFGLRNDLAARQQALKQAVTEARRKAEVMAEAANATLGIPVEISENGVSFIPKADYGGVMMARAAEMAPTPVSPGQLEIQANVTIRYRIMPKQ